MVIIAIVLISIICIIIVLFFLRKKYVWTIDRISNITSIYGVFLGICTLLIVSPQLVEVKPTPKLIVYNISAIERVSSSTEESEFLRKLNLPLAYCSARISNIGNSISYNDYIEFKSKDIFTKTEPNNIFSVFIDKEDQNGTFQYKKYNWENDFINSEFVKKDKNIYSFEIPTVKPNETIKIIIGFRKENPDKVNYNIMTNILDNGLDIRVGNREKKLNKGKWIEGIKYYRPNYISGIGF